jgi:hypothetical protein
LELDTKKGIKKGELMTRCDHTSRSKHTKICLIFVYQSEFKGEKPHRVGIGIDEEF